MLVFQSRRGFRICSPDVEQAFVKFKKTRRGLTHDADVLDFRGYGEPPLRLGANLLSQVFCLQSLKETFILQLIQQAFIDKPVQFEFVLRPSRLALDNLEDVL